MNCVGFGFRKLKSNYMDLVMISFFNGDGLS